MIPKFNNNIKQQTPLMLGQNGFGADMVSILAPRLVVLRALRPVLAVLATE